MSFQILFTRLVFITFERLFYFPGAIFSNSARYCLILSSCSGLFSCMSLRILRCMSTASCIRFNSLSFITFFPIMLDTTRDIHLRRMNKSYITMSRTIYRRGYSNEYVSKILKTKEISVKVPITIQKRVMPFSRKSAHIVVPYAWIGKDAIIAIVES